MDSREVLFSFANTDGVTNNTYYANHKTKFLFHFPIPHLFILFYLLHK